MVKSAIGPWWRGYIGRRHMWWKNDVEDQENGRLFAKALFWRVRPSVRAVGRSRQECTATRPSAHGAHGQYYFSSARPSQHHYYHPNPLARGRGACPSASNDSTPVSFSQPSFSRPSHPHGSVRRIPSKETIPDTVDIPSELFLACRK